VTTAPALFPSTPATEAAPDAAALRALLRSLAGTGELLPPGAGATGALAQWLIRAGLGPLAYRLYRERWPELAGALAADYYSAVAESSMAAEQLRLVETAFPQAAIPAVLLKGAALSRTVYEQPADRVMSDVDLWVHPEQMAAAFQLLSALGFTAGGKESRPPALQHLSRGEIAFASPRGRLLELHWSPFAGWWLLRTAAIDDEGLWARREPLAETPGLFQLAAGDTILHLAIHLAVNHQFGLYPLRSLVDMARTVQQRPVDWETVARRARDWRVATATWSVLALLDDLIGAPGAAPALAALRPGRLRCRLLARLVNPQRLLSQQDVRTGRTRYLLLLLLVDRPRDAARLIYRTLWPEDAWLEARYQQPTSRWRHFWNVARHGRI
jgi:hypothetical protein